MRRWAWSARVRLWQDDARAVHVGTVRPEAGEIRYREAGGRVVDLAQLSTGALRPYQRQVRLIFQDPFSSLNFA